MISARLGFLAHGSESLWQRDGRGYMLMQRCRVMSWPFPLPYAVCVFGGLMVGLLFGDLVFPSFEIAIGGPLGDLLLGVCGGLFAGMACEIASEIGAIFSDRRRKSS